MDAWAPEIGDSQGTSLMVPRGVDQHADFEIGGLSPARIDPDTGRTAGAAAIFIFSSDPDRLPRDISPRPFN